MSDSSELQYLRKRVFELESEVETLKASESKAMGLMMRGEQMRENLMIKAICAGAFGGKS